MVHGRFKILELGLLWSDIRRDYRHVQTHGTYCKIKTVLHIMIDKKVMITTWGLDDLSS